MTTLAENTTRGDGATRRDGKIVNMTASVDRLPVVEGGSDCDSADIGTAS
jgi:hypothetical protein